MFTVTIETDNAAFNDDPGAELADILGKLADTVRTTGLSGYNGKVRDTNGNTVGVWVWTGGDV